MPRVRTVRPFVCVLLAVATALGTSPAAVQACGCPATSRPTAPAPTPSTAQPDRIASCCDRPAGKSCCGPAKKPARCCGPAAKPAPATPASCECVRCDCGQPAAPQPADPTPPTPVGDFASVLVTAPPVPPVFLPLPAADRPAGPEFAACLPPPDLVTTLSRLTC